MKQKNEEKQAYTGIKNINKPTKYNEHDIIPILTITVNKNN